jgi:hypothetical protein
MSCANAQNIELSKEKIEGEEKNILNVGTEYYNFNASLKRMLNLFSRPFLPTIGFPFCIIATNSL